MHITKYERTKPYFLLQIDAMAIDILNLESKCLSKYLWRVLPFACTLLVLSGGSNRPVPRVCNGIGYVRESGPDIREIWLKLFTYAISV